MTRNRPAPGGNRPVRDATNVPRIVGEQSDLFTATRYEHGVVIGEPTPEPTAAADVTPAAAVAIAHKRLANTLGGEQWLRLADQSIKVLVLLGQEFTAEALHDRVGDPPNVGLPAVAIRRARLKGLIRPVGTTVAQRPEARGRLIRTWGPR